ncbi:MAG: sulfide-dependent adenosine diphosphate thiazole synthase [Victivallaceae bacterium]|nr:sulfide-dependent adenosine diphosphate thiazole synthase [Victivallaceae bacterium]
MAIENVISRAIVQNFSTKFQENLIVDAAIVGGGPSGLVAAKYLADAGFRAAVFERKLAPGGGTWGGGMLFNEVVVQQDALGILDDFKIDYAEINDAPGYYTLDSVEMASGLIFGAMKAGAKIFNSVSVEDIVFKDRQVAGLVINWTPVERLAMHVDPLTVMAAAVLDGTGHPSEIMQLAINKAGVKLDTETGGILGEKPMWADKGEVSTVANTLEYYPGLFASGMAANNVRGGYRMGPIFGGMLMSGKKAAGLIAAKLSKP